MLHTTRIMAKNSREKVCSSVEKNYTRNKSLDSRRWFVLLILDQLVLATGAQYNYFDHNEWAEFVQGLKSDRDALKYGRNVIFSREKPRQLKDSKLRANIAYVRYSFGGWSYWCGNGRSYSGNGWKLGAMHGYRNIQYGGYQSIF